MEINEGTVDKVFLLLRDGFRRGYSAFTVAKGSTENPGRRLQLEREEKPQKAPQAMSTVTYQGKWYISTAFIDHLADISTPTAQVFKGYLQL